MSFFNKINKDELLTKAKKATDKVHEVSSKATNSAKNYTDGLKQESAKNKELMSLPMEERVKMRPEGVKYSLVNNSGKILDVYDNKVIFTTTHSTSTIVTGLVLGGTMTQGEKTIYFKDAIGVQYKPSAIADGYIQVETSAGGATASRTYGGENSIQFSGKKTNDEAEIIVAFIKKQIEDFKNSPSGVVIKTQTSPIEELKKLKELVELDIITQEEFNEKKKELLSKI